MTNFLFILIFMLSQIQVSDWELKKDESGIKIYTRQVEGSNFDEFKGEVKLQNCTLSDVLEIILDVKNYESLYADCFEPKILKQNGKYYDIHYFKIKAPWPIENRDAVYEQFTILNELEGRAEIFLKPLPNFFEEQDGFTRIQNGTGFWVLTSDDNGTVTVIYQFHGDPGGDIPVWLVNTFVVSNPFNTLQNLKKELLVRNKKK